MMEISAFTRVIDFSFVLFCTLKDVLLALFPSRQSAVASSSFHATANWYLALDVYEEGACSFCYHQDWKRGHWGGMDVCDTMSSPFSSRAYFTQSHTS
jgi:hypothetical protein